MRTNAPARAVSLTVRTAARAAAALAPLAPLAALLACASPAAPRTQAAPRPSVGDSATIPDVDGGKSLDRLFAGRFPGVTVTPGASGGVQIRIRGGSNTFYGSNEPLFVVDDTPVAAGTGGIIFLSPYDIERIDVLKNPADIALYGVRGSNGVIKITTKRPGPR